MLQTAGKPARKKPTYEDVTALPYLRSWDEAVEGQTVRVGKDTRPPKQFLLDEVGSYTWGRLRYDPYSCNVYMDHRKTKVTIDGVLLFGRQMDRLGPSEPYNPFWTVGVERLKCIDEVFSQRVKAPDSETLWEVYVFRVGDVWYSDYTTYRTGDEAQAFTTASKAAAALEKRTRSRLPSPEDMEREATEKEAEDERVAADIRRQREEVTALEERRSAESAENAALEAHLADIERTRYLNELRAKLAQHKEMTNA
jgi:hypothetical protein